MATPTGLEPASQTQIGTPTTAPIAPPKTASHRSPYLEPITAPQTVVTTITAIPPNTTISVLMIGLITPQTKPSTKSSVALNGIES
jgi:hypothetical protein